MGLRSGDHLIEEPNREENNRFNLFNYPPEYFYAQILFANKIASITGVDFLQAIEQKTAIGRRFDDKNSLPRLVSEYPFLDEFCERLYTSYTSQSSALYVPKRSPRDATHYGVYGYQYLPNNASEGNKNTIKMHFHPSPRGEASNLSSTRHAERVEDLRQMTAYIHDNIPGAQIVVGGSWLYNVPGYRDPFPPEFINRLTRMDPLRMSFTGDSLWGQFINRNGFINPNVYAQFVAKVQRSHSFKDLINAFPYHPLHSATPISAFYDHFGIR